MAKRVRYTMMSLTPGAHTYLDVATQRDMVKALHSAAYGTICREYGFIVRKVVDEKVTDRYEVKVTVSLKRQPR